MTQLQAARRGLITEAMQRVATREGVAPELIRDEVARGRLVIPANLRHLAGSGGRAPAANASGGANGAAPVGHPDASETARFWVNQTAAQRAGELGDDDHCRGQSAPKRLDPTGIGRMITTKINAKIREIANPDGQKVFTFAEGKEALKNGKINYEGASSVLDFDQYGDVTPDFGVFFIEGGKFNRRYVVSI